MLRWYLLAVFFVVPVVVVNAQIKINEVQIEPNQVIELVNNGDDTVDISGWSLDDSGGSTFITLPPETWLAARSCMVFQESFNLNKVSSDSARLFDGSLLIDSVAYTKSPGPHLSWQRIPDMSDTIIATSSALTLWNASRENCIAMSAPTVTQEPTPTPQTDQPLAETPTPVIENISLSEIMPNPNEGTEWVELYNGNEFSVTLTRWYIDDIIEGGSSPKAFTLSLPALGYGVIPFTSSLFNNSGDTIRLLNQSQQELEKVDYSDAPEDLSYGKDGAGTWCFDQSTKGFENTPCSIAPTNTPAVGLIATPIPTTPKVVSTAPTIRLVLTRQTQSRILGTSAETINTSAIGIDMRIKQTVSVLSFLYSLGVLLVFCYTEFHDRYRAKILAALLRSTRGE